MKLEIIMKKKTNKQTTKQKYNNYSVLPFKMLLLKAIK